MTLTAAYLTENMCACKRACMCVCGGGGGHVWTCTWVRVYMDEQQHDAAAKHINIFLGTDTVQFHTL